MKKNIIDLIGIMLKIIPSFIIVFLYDIVKPYSQSVFTIIRYCLVKRLCKSVGDQVIIGSNVTIKHWRGIVIGNRVSIHDFSYIDGFGGISIGDDVSIAHNCTLISSHHTWSDQSLPIRLNPIEKRPISIEDNIWIACDVRILGGSIIRSNIIIGAGSIVGKEMKGNGIYFGHPAKFHRYLYENIE